MSSLLGLLAIFDDADIAGFLLSDGQSNRAQQANASFRSLADLNDEYLDQAKNGSVESSTISMLAIHARHLKRVLGEKLRLNQFAERHPGGDFSFTDGSNALTVNEVKGAFKRTVKGSKWDKLRGWHVFRHSFCRNCAAAGIDQRIINAWVGHQTEEMVRRYRHLIPNQEAAAIRQFFGDS